MSTKMKAGVATIVIAGAVVAGVVALAGSSGDGDSAADQDATATKVTTSTTMAFELEALCAVFQGIADRARAEGGTPGAGPGGGGPAQPTTKEGWDRRIKMTATIIDVAPPDLVDNAKTYLALVKDRAQLAADNQYATVENLPADVRNAFIADHRDEQARANELIQYATSQCNLNA
jgi:hypothetical protein